MKIKKTISTFRINGQLIRAKSQEQAVQKFYQSLSPSDKAAFNRQIIKAKEDGAKARKN